MKNQHCEEESMKQKKSQKTQKLEVAQDEKQRLESTNQSTNKNNQEMKRHQVIKHQKSQDKVLRGQDRMFSPKGTVKPFRIFQKVQPKLAEEECEYTFL